MAEFISSDTNVWIDFEAVDAIEMPFRLSCTYLMWAEAVENEVRSPAGLRERLLASGLVSVQVTAEEFWLADEYTERYSGISTYDAVALAIAKRREILLMTGDFEMPRPPRRSRWLAPSVFWIACCTKDLSVGRSTRGASARC